MNKKATPNAKLLNFMLRAQQIATKADRSEDGYAMVIVSILSIFLLSLLGAYLTMSNLSKSATNAYVDGNNTFYAAESGLNQRAEQIRQKFVGYSTPARNGATVPTSISDCFSVPTPTTTTSNDFECRNFSFRYNNNIATATNGAGATVLSSQNNNQNSINYTTFTYAIDATACADGTQNRPCAPQRITLQSGPFTGLNAQEYKYTVYSTAAKSSASAPIQSGEAKVVLQMSFTNQVIPIFQFGAFYARDLEFNPSPPSTFNGRIHSNGNIYLTAGDGNTLTIDGLITSANNIYTGNPALLDTYSATGQVLITTSPGVTTQLLPANPTPTTTQQVTNLTPYNNRVLDRTSGVRVLTLPPAGFLTKVDASQPNSIGEYYGKADLRLEMFPNRSVPFNFQSIASGTGTPGGCTTDPFTVTVSTGRNNYSTARCTNFSEGQLRSLMQPILVRPRNDDEYNAFCLNVANATRPQTASKIAIANTDLVVGERILDALALTLAAQTTPVAYSTLQTSNSLSPAAQAQFAALLANIPTLSAADITTLQGAAPAAIAALPSTTTNATTIKGGCFRPAPIQALFNPTNFGSAAALTANTATSFNDRREGRYIRMLQSNIASLTLWNRDGVFTQGVFDGDLATADAIAPTALDAKFTIDATTKSWAQNVASSGDNLLFVKDIARTVEADGTTPIPANSFRSMGLAAVDRTEGGLVFHATIDKTTYAYNARQSPYGFAFNDGHNLPAPLTVATDQALYAQGDWNNNDKQPASLLSDTLTVLSNSCLATSDTAADANNPAYVSGQLNCGKLAGFDPATVTTVNAAFLSRTDDSIDTGTTYYSGGLNNYMRMLEGWTNIAFNYRGSFVSLGAPQEVSGEYRACGGSAATYYCPPNRNWTYETDFDTFSKLPPLSPRIINLRQDVFKRNY